MTTMIVFRFIHVLFGVFWAGAVFFVAAFLLPGVHASGPAGGSVMQEVMGKRRFPVVAGIAAGLTILSGAGMYWHNVSISSGAWARSTPGIVYGVGAIAAIAGAVIFGAVIGPTGKKMLELGAAIRSAGGPPTPEQASTLGRLQARLGSASRLGASCLLIAVVAMATARYL